jgi:hypothetical protein
VFDLDLNNPGVRIDHLRVNFSEVILNIVAKVSGFHTKEELLAEAIGTHDKARAHITTLDDTGRFETTRAGTDDVLCHNSGQRQEYAIY